MTPTQAQTELATMLSDTLNQVSADRLTQAITMAFRDAWATYEVWDSSLTFTQGTYQYPVPSTMTTVQSIYIMKDTDYNPDPIDASMWEVVAGNIQFNSNAKFTLWENYTLYIRGRYKLQVGDTIPATNVTLQNYIVNLAASIVIKQIGYSKVLNFLHNDTTMAELIAFRNQVEQDLTMYRNQLQVTYGDG